MTTEDAPSTPADTPTPRPYRVHMSHLVTTTVDVEATSRDEAIDLALQDAPSPTNSSNHGIDEAGDWTEEAVYLDDDEVWSNDEIRVSATELARLRGVERRLVEIVARHTSATGEHPVRVGELHNVLVPGTRPRKENRFVEPCGLCPDDIR